MVWDYEVRAIKLEHLVDHPWRLKESGKRTRELLAKHIAATGCYEPLVVRAIEGGEKWEILHGHTRAEVLRALGYTQVMCVVWALSDAQVERWLATVHEVRDVEKPSRRLRLLERLLEYTPAKELARWLVEDEATLGKIDRRHKRGTNTKRVEAFTVFLSREVNEQLREKLRKLDRDPARALALWLNQ